MRKPGNFFQGVIEGSKAVYLVVAGLIVVGLLGIWKMNKAEFPTVPIKQGLVAAVYPGASAERVEETLTKPLEEVLMACPEVDRKSLHSVSKDGICYIYVTLDVPSDHIRQTWADIRFKFQTRKLTLPLNVLAIVIIDDFSNVSSILVSMESKDKGWSEMEEYARDLKERLQALPDVAKVQIMGSQSEEIAVTADMDRLAAYGISPLAINLTYTAEGLQLPSGSFAGEYADSRIYIDEPVSSEEEVSKKIVMNEPAGGVVRIEDVAEVERRIQKKSTAIQFNGNNTLLMGISMRENRDIVAFGADVDKILKQFESELPASVSLTRVTDQPRVVRTSVLNFLRDLFISILVVIFVMLLLFPFKSAAVASSGVPVCTAVALAAMFLIGMPLNTVTLAALIVVLGMIVDDSIVTIDGYMGKLAMGMTRTEAAIASAKELVMPMLMATLSISLMTFPMLFIINGNIKDVFFAFPWVMAITLMISLAYALTVIPSLEVRFIEGLNTEAPTGFAKVQATFFNALQNVYDKAERVCFRHPYWTLGSGIALVAAGIGMFFLLNIQMLPKASRDLFVMEMNLEEGCNLEATQRNVDSLSKWIMADKRVRNVTAFVGSSAPRFHETYAPALPAPNFAQLIVNTVSEGATQEMVPEYEEKYEFIFPNALIRIKEMDYQGVPAPVEMRVLGKDRDLMIPVADSIAAFMRAQNDIMKWVHSDYSTIPSVDITLDKDEASRLGINPAMVAMALGQEFSSTKLINSNTGGLPVALYGKENTDSSTYDVIRNKYIRANMPNLRVPLRQVATVSPGLVPAQLVRHSGTDNAITVQADMKAGKSHPVAVRRIKKYLENLNLPEGVRIKAGGLTEVNEVLIPAMGLSFVGALVVMFIFLLINFKKINIPVLTMSLSSLCLFGSFLGLYIFHLDMGMTVLLGVISLVGIIVRNGIIMFEYAEELHFKEGYSYKEAAMLAGSRRMRPIFLTSCTTGLGVLPMIISADALWMPMGVVILFGVAITLPFTVLIMPVSYWRLFAKKDEIK